jgi:hypothetical protein
MRLWITRAGSAAPFLYLWLLLLFGLVLGTAPVHAAGPESVTAGHGEVEVLEDGRGKLIELELRFPARSHRLLPPFLPKVAPLLGTVATSRGAFFVYAGLGTELPLGGPWRLVPTWAVGLYHKGEGQDLGGFLQFRTAVELSYSLDEHRRLGVRLDHVSNAGIFGRNPGSESLSFLYSARLGSRSSR